MKTLIDKIKSVGRKAGRGIKRGLLIATAVASLGVAGCDLGGNKPEPNYAPVASLSVNPASGTETDRNVTVNGEDPDGDIVNYEAFADYNNNEVMESEEFIASQSMPIDASHPFNVGNFKVYGQVTDSRGNIDKKSIDVVVDPIGTEYVTIQGNLQDNETDSDKFGETRVYIDGATGENYYKRDLDGNEFSFEVPSGSNVKIKGMIKQGTEQKSYVRTETRENVTDNLSDVLVRAVPYPTFCDENNFKTFMNQINTSYNGIRGFDLNQLQGIEILRGDPLAKGFNFTAEDQIFIKNKIENQEDIRIFIERKDFSSFPNWTEIQIDENDPGYPPENKKYEVVDGQIKPYLGWIVVTPNDSSDSEAKFFWDDDAGLIKRARINFGTTPSDAVTTHEFGHVFIASNPLTYGHSTILNKDYTIMTATELKSPPPGIADEKAAKIVYEDTYQYGEPLDNILGINF